MKLREACIDFVKRKEPSLLFGIGVDYRSPFRAIMKCTCKDIVRAVAEFVWDAFNLREVAGSNHY